MANRLEISAVSGTIADAQELYQHLLPSKVYHQRRTGLNPLPNVTSRTRDRSQNSTSHVLDGCSGLAKTKYLAQDNSVSEILFVGLLKNLDLIDLIPPWFSLMEPKPVHKTIELKLIEMVQFMSRTLKSEETARLDARIISKENTTVTLLRK